MTNPPRIITATDLLILVLMGLALYTFCSTRIDAQVTAAAMEEK